MVGRIGRAPAARRIAAQPRQWQWLCAWDQTCPGGQSGASLSSTDAMAIATAISTMMPMNMSDAAFGRRLRFDFDLVPAMSGAVFRCFERLRFLAMAG